MAFQGGDGIEVTYNHPTLGDGVFFIKSGEDTTVDTGGFRIEDDMGAIAGNGEPIITSNRMRWSYEFISAWDMVSTNEIQQLRALAGDPVAAQWTFAYANGSIWSGLGWPVGDIQGSGQDATITVKISGGGFLEKIAG